MKYQNPQDFSHSQTDKIGVLITNLGTPDSPTPKSLKTYLKEFLSDPRVIEVPRFIWWFVLNLVILNIRPSKSAKAYKTVWTDKGSPLLLHTQAQAKAIEEKIKGKHGDKIVVDYAMRYGNPSIPSKISSMLEQGVRKLVVLPLYPQYCASTSASTFDAIANDFVTRRWIPDFRFISHYHDNAKYIKALSNKIKDHWETHGQLQKLVFSYHGIPQRYLDNGDPYFCECHKTTRLVAEELGLEKDKYITTFQSRVGAEEWLKPYTDETLKSFPGNNIKDIQVVCPGFSADCLETIEEIGVENRDYFMESGGEKYSYIEALNSDTDHIEMLCELIEENLQGWNLPDQAHRAKLANDMKARN